MNQSATPAANHSAFDDLAPTYDSVFTNTSVMRIQRQSVWKVARQVFRPGQRILEINCGTGEDALFLARLGMRVVACDASRAMIEVAEQRRMREAPDLPIRLFAVPTENVRRAATGGAFDGVFSNFSGLNFVADLRTVAEDLAAITHPGANLLLCVASRLCVAEMAWFALRLKFRKAVRRLSAVDAGQVGERPLDVWYRSVHSFRREFAPYFRLRAVHGIGVAVPPYYFEPLAQRHRFALRLAAKCDEVLQRAPLLRVLGDHVLLHFEARPASS